jgi:MFS family permease
MEDVAAAVLERTWRVLASGSKAVARGSRFLGIQLRRGGRAVVSFTTSGGACKTGLARLVHLQFLTAAGDVTVAVSLAGTLFFTLPTDQARPQVAQFLLLTMAPFAIVAPLIGPFLDRFRRGRRWALGVSLALRAFLCWVLASILHGSTWLFLSALIFLVASKAFTITRAAAVPRLLPPGFTLVDANSRISMANVAGAAVGGGIAAGIALLGPEWSLRFGFLIFVAATVLAILLSPAVDSSAAERDTSSLPTEPAGNLMRRTESVAVFVIFSRA